MGKKVSHARYLAEKKINQKTHFVFIFTGYVEEN